MVVSLAYRPFDHLCPSTLACNPLAESPGCSPFKDKKSYLLGLATAARSVSVGTSGWDFAILQQRNISNHVSDAVASHAPTRINNSVEERFGMFVV